MENVVKTIFSLYTKYGGNQYDGEDVTQLQHMFQSAELAEAQGFDEEVVLAAFLHDIGHMCSEEHNDNSMNGFGIVVHEQIGANFLEQRGFSTRLVNIVLNHVNAKRYLTYKDPTYYICLSLASKETLKHQGGMMNEEEAVAFENNPHYKTIIALRLIDERAKDVSKPNGNMEKYKLLMYRHLQISLFIKQLV